MICFRKRMMTDADPSSFFFCKCPSVSVKLPYNLRTPIQPDHSAVQCDVIIPGIPPFHIGIKPMISGAPLVFVTYSLLR